MKMSTVTKWPSGSFANAVAILSFTVSVIALWQSYVAARPSIQIQDLPSYTFGVTTDGRQIYLTMFRFLISNSGGRAVSLNTISIPKGIAPVLGTSGDSRQATVVRSATFFKVQDNEPVPIGPLLERPENDEILKREAFVIGRKIEPGETIRLSIGLEYVDEYPEVEGLLVALDAHFSDHRMIPLRAAIDARIRRK
jgi:hypothetical protein